MFSLAWNSKRKILSKRKQSIIGFSLNFQKLGAQPEKAGHGNFFKFPFWSSKAKDMQYVLVEVQW